MRARRRNGHPRIHLPGRQRHGKGGHRRGLFGSHAHPLGQTRPDGSRGGLKGDLYVDAHHTIEDVGICLGAALKEALGDKSGIKRYGTYFVPMDETLAMVSLDASSRPFLVFDVAFRGQMCGAFDVQMTEEFFRGWR